MGIARWYGEVILGLFAMAAASVPIRYAGDFLQSHFELSENATTLAMGGMYFTSLIAVAWWVGLRGDQPRTIRYEDRVMHWLRYLLIVLTAAALATITYMSAKHGPPSNKDGAWFVLLTAAALVLNFIYLWLNVPDRKPGRLGTLFRLWLDAKEAELKRRAKESSR